MASAERKLHRPVVHVQGTTYLDELGAAKRDPNVKDALRPMCHECRARFTPRIGWDHAKGVPEYAYRCTRCANERINPLPTTEKVREPERPVRRDWVPMLRDVGPEYV